MEFFATRTSTQNERLFAGYGNPSSLLFVVAWLRGDPHFTTVDGKTYTFNGHGEYVLVKTRNPDVEIQVRIKNILLHHLVTNEKTYIARISDRTNIALHDFLKLYFYLPYLPPLTFVHSLCNGCLWQQDHMAYII